MFRKPNYKKVAWISYKILSLVWHLTDIKLKAQTKPECVLDTLNTRVFWKNNVKLGQLCRSYNLLFLMDTKMWKQTSCAQHQEESTILAWNLAYTHNVLHDTQSCYYIMWLTIPWLVRQYNTIRMTNNLKVKLGILITYTKMHLRYTVCKEFLWQKEQNCYFVK